MLTNSLLFKQSQLLCTPLYSVQSMGISRFRKKHGLYSFKIGKDHKNPHAMALKSKEHLKK